MDRARISALWKEWCGTQLISAFRSSLADIYDSRYIGFIPRAAITGRAFAVGHSLDPAHHYLPRLSRSFQALH